MRWRKKKRQLVADVDRVIEADDWYESLQPMPLPTRADESVTWEWWCVPRARAFVAVTLLPGEVYIPDAMTPCRESDPDHLHHDCGWRTDFVWPEAQPFPPAGG